MKNQTSKQALSSWRWLLLLFLLSFSCNAGEKNASPTLDEVAATDEVAAYMKAFEGRGDQTDDSQPTSPDQVLKTFNYPEDLALDLLAAEPLVHQPVELNFDHRGRLWVVQYGQYPFPAGLKVTGYDYHLRAQFDKVPQPPPQGVKGADKITLLEDTDLDGRYDKATDAITGLNIATSVCWGREKIWVLNPPYLLAYPDPDGDGFPNGEPSVHLEGFGLEDTHAVANSLCWGPDGWLYGAQGSTTTANISSSVTKNVQFNGQGIWRYHPETEIFELFAEGGGNTFHVEMDDKGRIYSGHNGGEARGQYYKQGAYYPKNWGKHGALTNPYSFGFLDHMKMEGENLRFTHAFVRYGGNGLPARYHDALIGINPLHNFLQVSRFAIEGSTFKTIDTERILSSKDHWFRPVDIQAGPDGGIYLADWYDSRLSHIDPRDTWHRASGRIYRLKNKNSTSYVVPDFSQLTNAELIQMLAHENRWMRQQALRQFGDRKDASVIPELKTILLKQGGQLALEALWAINLSGGFDEAVADIGIHHIDPFVRVWAVRLLGDQHKVSPGMAKEMAKIAQDEGHPEVRGQLASSAKRLAGVIALPIIKALIDSEENTNDPNNPLLYWWALEAKAESDRLAIGAMFKTATFWENPIVKEVLLERLGQRYVMAGGKDNLEMVSQLLKYAPSAQAARPLLTGFTEGLRGQQLSDLPPGLNALVNRYKAELGENTLSLALRQGDDHALEKVLMLIADPMADRIEKLEYVQVLGDINKPQAVPVLLGVVERNQASPALRQAALNALQHYSGLEIGTKVANWYPHQLRADPGMRRAALALLISRPAWARELLHKIKNTREIRTDDISLDQVQQLLLLNDEEMVKTTRQLWPDVRPLASADKAYDIQRFKTIINTQTGDIARGQLLFNQSCGACHRLFGQGGTIGPDLTGYERKNLDYLLLHIVDPNADIREGYLNYLLTTKDGRYLTGTITDQSAKTVRFRSISGEETVWPMDEIATLKAQEISLMPERLLNRLSDQEISDLFSYLREGETVLQRRIKQ
ncbi:MAG: c-type cytochrome [Saprospiraceae bacterium]